MTRPWLPLVVTLALAGCSAAVPDASPAPAPAGGAATAGPSVAATGTAAPTASASATGPAQATASTSAAPSATTATAAGSASAAPTQATRPATPALAGQKLTVALAGDMLWHTSLLSSVQRDAEASGASGPYDFEPLLAGAKPLIERADLAVCNQEIPILAPGQEPEGYPRFGAPYEAAKATAAVGFDACTTASNHSYDKDEAGLRSTLTALRDAGVTPCGTAATQAEGEAPCLVTTKNGVKVGLVTGAWGLNGGAIERYAEKGLPEWKYHTYDPEAMIKRAKAARAAGAQVVLGSIHAGDEYVVEPNEDQVYVSNVLAKSGEFDLIYGHHAHVPQPWTKVNGTLVIHGLGNFVGQMRTNTPFADEGYVAQLTFTADAAGKFSVSESSYAPIFITHATQDAPARLLHVTDPAAAKHASKARLATAQKRIAKAVGSLGLDVTED